MADESLASAVVKRLRNQPFLFVLGIAALLIGVLTSGAGFGTPELRIILATIGGLAFLVVIGYYVQAVLRVRNTAPSTARVPEPVSAARAPDHAPPPAGTARTPDPAPTYNVSAPSSVIGAIGPNATITMNNAPPPVAAPAPAAPSPAPADELDRVRRNLARLESRRALYAAGTEPRELLDEIAREQRRIAELTSPTRTAAPPDGGRSG